MAAESSRQRWPLAMSTTKANIFVDSLPPKASTSTGPALSTATVIWLAGTSAPWNKILSVVGLELSELQTTTLCLRSNDVCSVGEPSVHAPCNGAYLLAWLPEQHTCVQSICLHENIQSYKTPALAHKMLLPFSAHLRHLTLEGRYSIPFSERDLCNSMTVLKTLETFECFELRINYCDLARGVATLLHRNRRHLTKVRFQNNKLSPQSTASFLSALLECQVLSELSFNRNHLNKGNVESLAVILHSLRNLKKLSLDFSIYSKEPFGPIAEALESNASLEELSLKSCQVEFKLLFEALHTNTTLKMLNLECCTMTFNEVKYFAATLSLNKGLRTVLLPNCQLKDEGITLLAHAMAINNILQKLDLHDNSGMTEAVMAFCQSLKNNGALRSIIFGRIKASDQQSAVESDVAANPAVRVATPEVQDQATAHEDHTR
ncbi:hypothetical protein HPB51_022503 [Rhipicephalus microplus]|uniref:Uncharacterized protein n=1 Tax=Rhipicephalus microplus TaxID=6941 RepID=A0A9J6ED07_RHIMP|nr:hypothetical protein HPB51_022503 [Rhipicephalus microplus]